MSQQFDELRKKHPGRNIIFYGPPGTGKTHALLKDYAETYFSETVKNPATSAERESESIRKLADELNWWEVIALAMAERNAPVKVSELLQHPFIVAKLKRSSCSDPGSSIRARLQVHTKDDCPNVSYDIGKRLEPKIFFKKPDSTWCVDVAKLVAVAPRVIKALETYRHASVTEKVKRYTFVTFHQSYSYENFVEGISAVTDEDGQLSYRVTSGIFADMCARARANPGEPYALFIDEINRGNVSGIFGELITLIEDSKRQGQAEEIAITLPYSRQLFTVPENLYIIGSMNTADRSVEALDTALRRRFSFVEVPPRPDLLGLAAFRPAHLGIDLQRLLESINRRVEYLLDRDHCIGHSYFMTVRGNSFEEELDNLRRVFKDHIIPLLEDCFYGNLEKVAMVLGSKFVTSRGRLNASCLLEDVDDMDLPDKHLRALADLSALKEEDFAELITK